MFCFNLVKFLCEICIIHTRLGYYTKIQEKYIRIYFSQKLNHFNFKCFLPVCPTCQCWSEQAYIENVTIVSASDTDLSHTKICIKYRKHGHYFFSSTIDFVHILSTSVKIGTKLEPYNCADD